jgi:hypothetical protein
MLRAIKQALPDDKFNGHKRMPELRGMRLRNPSAFCESHCAQLLYRSLLTPIPAVT